MCVQINIPFLFYLFIRTISLSSLDKILIFWPKVSIHSSNNVPILSPTCLNDLIMIYKFLRSPQVEPFYRVVNRYEEKGVK